MNLDKSLHIETIEIESTCLYPVLHLIFSWYLSFEYRHLQHGATPTWGRPMQISKRSHQTSAMVSNLWCSLRWFQVKSSHPQSVGKCASTRSPMWTRPWILSHLKEWGLYPLVQKVWFQTFLLHSTQTTTTNSAVLPCCTNIRMQLLYTVLYIWRWPPSRPPARPP